MDAIKRGLGSLRRKKSTKVNEEARPWCNSSDCPIPFAHYQGQYLFDNQPTEEDHPVWGKSNPPPFLWKAYERFAAGNASAAEKDAILAFAEHHACLGWRDHRDIENEDKGVWWRERTLNGRKFRNDSPEKQGQ